MFVMSRRARSVLSTALPIVLVSTVAAAGVHAPQAVPPPRSSQAASAPPLVTAQQTPVYRQSQDAEQTRRDLNKMLSHFSPNVGRVLALDPLLLQNAAYLEPYPELVAFLSQHPEVTRNAAYYFSGYRSDYYAPPDAETQALRAWNGFFAGVAFFFVFCIVIGALVWLIRTLVDYRRWYRLSKVQTEAHNKLLDRFGANEDLLAYIATPSGRRFLESAPIMLDEASSATGPMRRILWSIQVGVVVIFAGLGLMVARRGLPAEFSQMLFVVAIFAVALGVGFVVAAAASAIISKRLGILAYAAPRDGRATDGQAGA
jgi:hypothetical protein